MKAKLHQRFFRNILCGAVILGWVFLAAPVRGQTIPTTITLMAPTNGQSFTAGVNIYVHAQFTDTNPVKLVQYREAASSTAPMAVIGTVTNTAGYVQTNLTQGNPFAMTWSNVPAGSYVLTAVAYDSSGAALSTSPVGITVTNPVVRPAVYIYSPTNNSKFTGPTNLMLYARSVEGNTTGAVATVQFFANSLSLGIVSNNLQAVFTNISTEPLFPLLWSNAPPGSYALTAVATDLHGITATSSVVNLTLTTNVPPTPVPYTVALATPTNGQTFAAPASVVIYAKVTDSNAVQTVTYYANGGVIGSATGAGTSGSNPPGGSPTNYFAITWTNVPAGSYALSAVALDSAGLTATSTPVNITVTNVPVRTYPPSVAIYSPTNGTTFGGPTNVSLYARATESNGTIATVTFLENGAVLGVVTNTSLAVYTNISSVPLFALTWSNAPSGSYSLTALATDLYGNQATSAVVAITIKTNLPPPPVPYTVAIPAPTNGQVFAAPATVGIYARVTDSNAVQSVTYYANGGVIGTGSSSSPNGAPTSVGGSTNYVYFTWTNVPAGSYALTAVALDSAGLTATSGVVNVSVTNVPVKPGPPLVAIYSPANGATYTAPTNVNIYARATESNGTIATVQFRANGTVLGVVTNTSLAVYTNVSSAPLFLYSWLNAPAGSYSLTAVATDVNGNCATSAVVAITLKTNPPPRIIPYATGFWYPTNGQWFVAPATVGLHAWVTDSNVVQSMTYYANGTAVGTVGNSAATLFTNSTAANPFFLGWSNVTAGTYALTAVALDSAGLTATSAPVNIFVLSNPPPVISVYAPDPVAVEGTNASSSPVANPAGGNVPPTSATNYVTGGNTATFLFHRTTPTNSAVTVYYSIGGTAINGVDYQTLPGYTVIPAGSSYSLVTIYPLQDTNAPEYAYYDSVILTVKPVTNTPPAYTVGSPSQAGAVILEDEYLPIQNAFISALDDNSLHVSLPGTNGLNFCLEVSTNLTVWTPVCTNTVLKGSAQFVDPAGPASPVLYYRVVPAPLPANY